MGRWAEFSCAELCLLPMFVHTDTLSYTCTHMVLYAPSETDPLGGYRGTPRMRYGHLHFTAKGTEAQGLEDVFLSSLCSYGVLILNFTPLSLSVLSFLSSQFFGWH